MHFAGEVARVATSPFLVAGSSRPLVSVREVLRHDRTLGDRGSGLERREELCVCQLVNPAAGETLASFPATTPEALEAALALAESAFLEWAASTFERRREALTRVATLLRERSTQLAERMALEMGKPLPQGAAEVEKCAFVREYFAEHAEAFLADEPAQLEFRASTAYRPLGPVLAIMPWNFPLWQAFRFLAPTLMAGNVGLLKHAENVPGCAEDLISVLDDAGVPPGVFQNLRLPVERVAAVIASREVRAVTLHGIDPCGAIGRQSCGGLSQ